MRNGTIGRPAAWAVLALAAAACEGTDRPPPHAGGPGRLAGSWSVELWLEHPAQLRTDAGALPPVRGEVVLRPDTRGGRAVRRDAPRPYYGTHTLDAGPFGIRLAARSHVPGATAEQEGDSVRLTVDPQAPGGGLRLAGTLMGGDSAAGHWSWHGSGRAAAATGRFILRRRDGQ
ncbi:MAG TPA: hypothetical protein VFQ45_13270 [Longimicrobium sp.]|nr:hypothetical protein [Longimicrobium sp.]